MTIGAIADRMSVTRPVVYKCFADRVELIEELLQRESALVHDGLVAALHQAQGPDPEAAFITGYTAMLRFIESRPGAWRLLFSADPDPAVAANFAAAKQAVAHHSSRWIRPALESWWGKTDLDTKLPALIELFMASGEAAARTILDPESHWTPDALGEFYGRIMCQAFRAA
ncbi:hypothetical protein GCM10011410_05550 [Hoyosella rhizosphaerae]|uniref:TetR family transcriptional regulator n=1 Tax=Hoyosella rhizosphaerae TaxID=1755582 RepID=A0A916X916_9ACTN|nr:hypothetical protein GCM10011410_05550 [Hoyosella rhizosphaerae]